MAAVYDNSADIEDFGVTTLTTPSFTISGANRAACLGVHGLANISAISGSCGGVSGTLVTNTNRFFNSMEVQLIQVIAPATGSQTATASWTTSTSASLSVITATGVDQTTPLTQGATAEAGFATSINQPVTSASGDLTTTICGTGAADELQTTNKTQRTTAFHCSDTGDGTGTQTHTWTPSGAMDLITAGANFLQVAAGGGLVGPSFSLCLTGVN
jgi:hypothetical protein